MSLTTDTASRQAFITGLRNQVPHLIVMPTSGSCSSQPGFMHGWHDAATSRDWHPAAPTGGSCKETRAAPGRSLR